MYAFIGAFMFFQKLIYKIKFTLHFQIDKSVLSVMTDEQMAKYMSSYGDRLAVISCQQTSACSDKESLLHNLRAKIEARKLGSKSSKTLHGKACVFPKENNLLARHKNVSAERTSRRIEIGWLHFGRNGYQQVRTNNGGGTRHLTVQKKTTVLQIMEMGKKLFFPNGESPKGPETDLTFHVCDFKRNHIPMDSTVGDLYELTKLKLLRFYICTKQEVCLTDVESLSDGDEEKCNENSLLQDGFDRDTERPAAKESSHGHDRDLEDSNTHFLGDRLSSNKGPKRKVREIMKTDLNLFGCIFGFICKYNHRTVVHYHLGLKRLVTIIHNVDNNNITNVFVMVYC